LKEGCHYYRADTRKKKESNFKNVYANDVGYQAHVIADFATQ
jgi:hypothetical protein